LCSFWRIFLFSSRFFSIPFYLSISSLFLYLSLSVFFSLLSLYPLSQFFLSLISLSSLSVFYLSLSHHYILSFLSIIALSLSLSQTLSLAPPFLFCNDKHSIIFKRFLPLSSNCVCVGVCSNVCAFVSIYIWTSILWWRWCGWGHFLTLPQGFSTVHCLRNNQSLMYSFSLFKADTFIILAFPSRKHKKE